MKRYSLAIASTQKDGSKKEVFTMLTGLLISLTMNIYMFNDYIVERSIVPRYDYSNITESEYHSDKLNLYILNDIPEGYDINGQVYLSLRWLFGCLYYCEQVFPDPNIIISYCRNRVQITLFLFLCRIDCILVNNPGM